MSDHWENLFNGRLSRRQLMKLGLSAAAIAGIEAACGTPASTSPSGTGALNPIDNLVVQVWPYDLDTTTKALQIYKQQYGKNAQVVTVPGDYYATTATRLAAGNPPMDTFEQDAGFLAQYTKNKWVVDLEGLPGIEQLKGEMLDSVRKSVTGPDGKVYALPNYVNVIVMFYNETILSQHGMQPATDWDQLFDQCVTLKKAGVPSPFIPIWATEFDLTRVNFVNECISRGMTSQFDSNLNPLWDTNPVANDVLVFWRRLQDADLVTPDALTIDHVGSRAVMAAGKGAYLPGNLLQLKGFNDPLKSTIAGHAHLTMMPGKAHASLTFTAVQYQTTRSDRLRAWPLTSFVDGYDKNGKFTGPIQIYAIGGGELLGYKSAISDPTITAAWSSFATQADFAVMKQQSANAYAEGDVLNQTWYSQYNDYTAKQLSRYLARQVDAATVLKDTADYARKLKAKG